MIKLKNIHKSFGDLNVLNGVNLHIKKGEIVVVVGPSGSGKSTVLRTMNLLDYPEKGEVFINDENITCKKVDLNRVRHNIGMVFQHFYLFPHMTVLENVTYAPIKVMKVKKLQAEQDALEILQSVGMKDKAHVYPSQLSGGQKQRVAIARSLALKPEILLFDEPTSALDPEMVSEVLEVIAKLTTTGITMVIVTHVMNFARDVGSRLLFLNEGQIIEDSSPSEFFLSPKTERAQLFLSKIL